MFERYHIFALMYKEWQLAEQPRPNQFTPPRFQWIHSRGEVEYSLILYNQASSKPNPPPTFEIARIIDHPSGVIMFKRPTDYDFQDTLEKTASGGEHINIVNLYSSPEQLEEGLTELRLPLPQGYKAAWEYVERNPV